MVILESIESHTIQNNIPYAVTTYIMVTTFLRVPPILCVCVRTKKSKTTFVWKQQQLRRQKTFTLIVIVI